jgi:hypothetical protein
VFVFVFAFVFVFVFVFVSQVLYLWRVQLVKLFNCFADLLPHFFFCEQLSGSVDSSNCDKHYVLTAEAFTLDVSGPFSSSIIAIVYVKFLLIHYIIAVSKFAGR